MTYKEKLKEIEAFTEGTGFGNIKAEGMKIGRLLTLKEIKEMEENKTEPKSDIMIWAEKEIKELEK